MKLLQFSVLVIFLMGLSVAGRAADPVCVDERLQLSMFASSPDIVQPVSATFDARGRLLVIENHTHFRPDDYEGPATDRIRVLADTDQDGVADTFSTYFEGERDAMDLALHPDGSIYLATRRKILRLRDVDNDGHADASELIVQLKTEGNYPHNGLSGLVFDFEGNLGFGFGENLGEPYTLVGSDGTTLAGGGEGGTTYQCTADGKRLERVATGFWNPFGQCRDAFGNVFAVDNDPDAMPPCRLLHVLPGANFGYQFRYGRPGNHPLQTWNGTLPGTMPMVAGTGEAPCEVICYAGDDLPEDYVGDLLVASWGDHRIERYRLQRKGASFEAQREVIVQGDTTFWPVGIAVAPDGSLFITDWGSRSYPLHGEGKVWHLVGRKSSRRNATSQASQRQEVFRRAGDVLKLGSGGTGDADQDFMAIATNDPSEDVRALAVRLLVNRQQNVDQFATPGQPATVRAVALANLGKGQLASLTDGLNSNDPAILTSSVRSLVRHRAEATEWCTADFLSQPPEGMERVATGVALACEMENSEAGRALIPAMLQSSVADIRFVAARWAADHNLQDYADAVRSALDIPSSDFRITMGIVAAHRHLQGGKLNDDNLPEILQAILVAPSQSSATKLMAIRAARPGSIETATIRALLSADDPQLVRETIYATLGDDRPEIVSLLKSLSSNADLDDALRADALVALDAINHDTNDLLKWAASGNGVLAKTAANLLIGDPLDEANRAELDHLPESLTGRLGPGATTDANARGPSNGETDIDMDQIAARIRQGDVQRGRRLFHNTRLLQCASCHTVSNRGAAIGPNLTQIGRTQSIGQLLNSILLPNQRIAPQYQPWIIVEANGKARTGYHLASRNLVETFVDANGELFEVHQDEIEQRIAAENSIMPSGLVDHLTDQELSDLMAYLTDG